ncbi:MAG TPA: ABC transporter permease [Candidatus Micrarchaeaceae archaeon]|nr:ABC transporter permease [Candidatus Micrarchaeaceae archaeon]
MWEFVGRRLLAAVPVLVGASVVLFALLYVLPGDPAAFALGDNASPAAIAAFRHQLGLDLPWYVQYFDWLGRMVTGQFGKSFFNEFPVVTLMDERLPVTLELTLGALVVGTLIGVPVGVYSGLNPSTMLGRAIDLLNAVFIAVPVFWLGILLQLGVALRLGWLPPGGYVPVGIDFGANIRSMVLPWLTLGVGTAAVLARFLQAGVRDAVTSEYVLAAEARGLTRIRIVGKHVMRNAVVPAITAFGIQVGRLIGGAVLTESVFTLPGLGTLLWTALVQRDYFVIQAVTLFAVAAFILVNLLTDIAYGVVDARIREGY